MKSLVIISPYLPAQTPNTLRWQAILNEWRSSHHELHVLTTRWSAKSHEEVSGLHIHRTSFHSLLDVYYYFVRKKVRRSFPGNKSVSRNRLLNKVLDLVWRRWYWPDGTMLFLGPGKKRALKLHKEHVFDNVISIGLPFTCHLIARELKSINPSLHWLMDIEDPFCYSEEFRVNNYKRYSIKNKHEERKAFELADSIVLTNAVARDTYASIFPENRSKLSVIPPLLEIPEPTHTKMFKGVSFTTDFAYFGSFYENVRSPESLLNLLNDINNRGDGLPETWRFHIFGEMTEFSMDIFSRFSSLEKHFVFHGLLSRRKLFAYLESMDFLINFGNKTNYHLPSKLVEFLYFQKPLLNFISRKDDSSRLFLEGKVPMLNLDYSTEDPTKLTDAFLRFVEESKYTSTPSADVIKPYLPAKIAASYKRLLDA